MSLAVSTRTVISMPRKKKSMNLFHHLLSDMRHQRIAVITLSVGQAVNELVSVAKLQISSTKEHHLKIF